jgi:hypothetical protein
MEVQREQERLRDGGRGRAEIIIIIIIIIRETHTSLCCAADGRFVRLFGLL